MVSRCSSGQRRIRTDSQSLFLLFHSPYFLVLYNIAATIGFWIIYATRRQAQYYQLRVISYGILLGRVVGEGPRFLN
jgi:hypothetical protein